ncbi:hypothetical protein EV182_004728, partial [Spiromyces aspiralis]
MYLPPLQTALDKYCRGTRVAFNIEKTELLLVGTNNPEDATRVGMTPVPDGQPIRYLGGFLGNSISHTKIVDRFIEDLLLHAVGTASTAATLTGCATLLATYTISKITFMAQMIPFTPGQLDRLDRALRKLLWDHSRPWLPAQTASLPMADGGLCFPSAKSIVTAAQAKFAHRFLSLMALSHSDNQGD